MKRHHRMTMARPPLRRRARKETCHSLNRHSSPHRNAGGTLDSQLPLTRPVDMLPHIITVDAGIGGITRSCADMTCRAYQSPT